MQVTNIIRRKVSQNRKRLVEGRYDLDLTYISDNIIAMGYPSDKALQSLIRNRIESVAKFLNERHEDSYRIFNLCKESDYDISFFGNRVVLVPLEDHNPPTFSQIINFCDQMDKWLKESPQNMAVIHCKAGKGRTGTMICNYFLHTKQYDSPFDAIEEFDRKRCKDCKGVTIPSQRRYIEYYAHFLKTNRTYIQTELKLKSLKIYKGKNYHSSLSFLIQNRENFQNIYESKIVSSDEEKNFVFTPDDTVILKDDLKFSFLNKKKETVFTVSFNTFFLLVQPNQSEHEKSCLGEKTKNDNEITYSLNKNSIDMIFKNKNIDNDLKIEFKFEVISENRSSSLDESTASSTESSTKIDPDNSANKRYEKKFSNNSSYKQTLKKHFSPLPNFLQKLRRSKSETRLSTELSNNQSCTLIRASQSISDLNNLDSAFN